MTAMLDFIDRYVYAKLTEREKFIASKRQKDLLGIGENCATYKQIGQELGITATRVRDIRMKIEQKINRQIDHAFVGLSQPHVIVKEVLVTEKKDNANLPMAVRHIWDLGDLSTRAYYGLKGANLTLVDDILKTPESELLKIPNFGRKSLNEVKEVLAMHGLGLDGHW